MVGVIPSIEWSWVIPQFALPTIGPRTGCQAASVLLPSSGVIWFASLPSLDPT